MDPAINRCTCPEIPRCFFITYKIWNICDSFIGVNTGKCITTFYQHMNANSVAPITSLQLYKLKPEHLITAKNFFENLGWYQFPTKDTKGPTFL